MGASNPYRFETRRALLIQDLSLRPLLRSERFLIVNSFCGYTLRNKKNNKQFNYDTKGQAPAHGLRPPLGGVGETPTVSVTPYILLTRLACRLA